jgi:membrane associated rhomboid family serine protease
MRSETWRLTEGLVFLHFAVFLLSWTSREALIGLAVMPGQVVARPWSLVTYQFVHGASIFWFFISMMVLWIMAKPLEESWGSPRFLIFWLVATFGASLTAAGLGLSLAGDTGVGTSILLTFATLYPEVEFRLFFLIPVKVKYLAVVAAAWLAFASLQLGLLPGLANVAGTCAGYLFFLATRHLPTRRKIAFELRKRRVSAEVKQETVAAEHNNLVWDPKVRAAAGRAREQGGVAPEDEGLLAELDAAKDPTVTVCAPSEFGFIDDPVCRTCPGFAECAARKIRMAAEGTDEER